MKLLGFKKLTPVQKISLSFLGVITVGAVLLLLPAANNGHQSLNVIDALFVSTSATCVTGLTVVVPVEQFNHFGQFVMIVLMQIGGLGLMTLVASFSLILKERLSLNHKIAMKEVLNQNNVSNFSTFIKAIIKYTLFFEMIGVIVIGFDMIPQFGLWEGIFKAVYLSVAAFCNAGFDVLGANSLMDYAGNTSLCVVIMALIICGGLGFVVWFELKGKLIQFLRREMTMRQLRASLTLHTKLVIIATLVLIFGPALLIFITEFANPETLGPMSLWDKIINALFMSVTLRTAGFTTIDCAAASPATQLLMMICMFIGGAPGGTAGGIKVTTLMVIVICVIRSLRGKQHTNAFHRHISREIIVRATTIVAINLAVLLIGIFLLLISEKADMASISFEATSALATVGLSMNFTPLLTPLGRLIIILLMFVGRIGIMTFIMSFVRDDHKSDCIHYPEGHVMVG